MFYQTRPKTTLQSAFAFFEVVFLLSARAVRSGHRSPFVALLLTILQSCILVVAFFAMFHFIGIKGSQLRGDFLLYIMSGIFMYMTHVQTVSAVMDADAPTSAMMQHSPMNTLIGICSKGLSALYKQTLSLVVILFAYHVMITPFTIKDPISAFGMFLLAWFSGCAVGLVFYALKPWFPALIKMASTIYRRVNMFASGKMFVANTLPGPMLAMFDWNPLFHVIDQGRGYVFGNYFPRNSNYEYTIYVSLALIMIGLMGEFYTRKHASMSWGAR